MNENEIKDGNNTASSSNEPEKDGVWDEHYDNPYARFICKDDDAKIRTNAQNENPYSRFNQKNTEKDAEENEYSTSADAFCAPLIDESAVSKDFSRIGFAFALFTAVTFAVSLIIQMVIHSLNSEFYSSVLFRNLVTPVSLYLFALPILMILLSKCEAKAPEKKRMGFWKFILFVIVAFGFMYIGSFIGNAVMEVLSSLLGYDYGNSLESLIDTKNIWLTAIFTVIIAPIGEEFVFRKLLIDRTQKYGPFISIGLSGLMFGLMHGNFYQFFYAFALGLLLGYVYLSTGKLYLSILIHAVVNFVGSVIAPLLLPISEKLDGIDLNDTEAVMSFIQENIIPYLFVSAFGGFVSAAMLCAVIFPVVFRKKLRLPGGEIKVPQGRLLPVVILNGGIITMLIVYVLEFGLSLLQ